MGFEVTGSWTFGKKNTQNSVTAKKVKYRKIKKKAQKLK